MEMTRYRTISFIEKVPDTLDEFKGWEFSSGGTTGKDFKVFVKKFKAYIKRNLPENAELINFNSGHYYLSGFVKRNDKFVYFSISDVRHFPDAWVNRILVRTAGSEKDYTGGSNHYTSLKSFKSFVSMLLK